MENEKCMKWGQWAVSRRKILLYNVKYKMENGKYKMINKNLAFENGKCMKWGHWWEGGKFCSIQKFMESSLQLGIPGTNSKFNLGIIGHKKISKMHH